MMFLMRTLLAVGLLVVAPAVVQAKEYTAERFDSRIEVLKGGSLRVTETIVVRFEKGTFTFFFRTVPTRLTDGVEFVAAAMDGRPLPQGEAAGQVEIQRKNGLRVEWHFTPVSSSTHTFEVTYIARGVAIAAGERDVIAWRALPSEHDYRIENSRVEMALPSSPADPPVLDVRRVANVTETHTDARVLATATGIGKNGWLEIKARLPQGSVIDAPPQWQQRQLLYREYRTPALIAAAVIGLAGLVMLFGIRQGYDQPSRDRHTSSSFSGPPDMSPPAIAGALVTNGHPHLEHAMGTLFGLAAQGAVTIHEEPRGRFRQRIFTIARGRASRPPAAHERALLEELFSAKTSTDGQVTLDSARKHLVRHFSRFKAAVQQEMTDAGLFDSGRRQVRKRFTVVGATLLGLAILSLVPVVTLIDNLGPWLFVIPLTFAVLGFTSLILSVAHTPLSNEGVRRADAWRAYQKQLREIPKHERSAGIVPGPRSPSDLLPFAVALGLAAAWAKIFKDRGTQLPAWFHAASSQDANTGFVAFVGHGGAGMGGHGGGGGAAGGGASGAG
jgi:hypothetical protein